MKTETFSWRHLILPRDPLEFWTLALTLATVGLGVVAFFGLRSVSLSKNDMKNRTTNDPGEVSFEKTEEVKKINSAIEWMGRLQPPLIEKSIFLMNKLETWSMSFTHNPSLADEKVAFEPCSTVFCQMVMSLYPGLLAQRRANPESGPYQNIVTLFQGWYAKKAQAPMLEQLKRLQLDGSRLPPPIGHKP